MNPVRFALSVRSNPGSPCLVMVLFALAGQPAAALSLDLFDGFRPGWRESWVERGTGRGSARYEVVPGQKKPVLRATSAGSASGLWRGLRLERPRELLLSWRWKVEKSLKGNESERRRKGDDFAARVLIVFGPGLESRRTRGLCYVWAGSEPVGSVFPNPYTTRIATIVLESGDERKGQWVSERRDALSDFRAAFGANPDSVAGVAVMVDTDDTQTTATSWFDDLQIHHGIGLGGRALAPRADRSRVVQRR